MFCCGCCSAKLIWSRSALTCRVEEAFSGFFPSLGLGIPSYQFYFNMLGKCLKNPGSSALASGYLMRERSAFLRTSFNADYSDEVKKKMSLLLMQLEKILHFNKNSRRLNDASPWKVLLSWITFNGNLTHTHTHKTMKPTCKCVW